MVSLGVITPTTATMPQISFFGSTILGLVNQDPTIPFNQLEGMLFSSLGMSTPELIGMSDPLTQFNAGMIGGLVNLFV